jgi:hypothetical protein
LNTGETLGGLEEAGRRDVVAWETMCFHFSTEGEPGEKGAGVHRSSGPWGWAEGEGRKSFQEKLWGNS